MCGGIPFMIASVAKILLKSWGVNLSGCAEASVRPCGQGGGDQLRMVAALIGRFSAADAPLEQHRHGWVNCVRGTS